MLTISFQTFWKAVRKRAPFLLTQLMSSVCSAGCQTHHYTFQWLCFTLPLSVLLSQLQRWRHENLEMGPNKVKPGTFWQKYWKSCMEFRIKAISSTPDTEAGFFKKPANQEFDTASKLLFKKKKAPKNPTTHTSLHSTPTLLSFQSRCLWWKFSSCHHLETARFKFREVLFLFCMLTEEKALAG